MPTIPNLSLDQIYPQPVGSVNFNTCHNPDCGNFGSEVDLHLGHFIGSGSASSGAQVPRSNSQSVGYGHYKLDGTAGPKYRRVSSVFEYAANPHTWLDRKSLECQFDDGHGVCETHFELLSNQHLVDEIDRLRQMNGVIDGPRCGACRKPYLEAPGEFILDGAEISAKNRTKARKRRKDGDDRGSMGPDRVRLIHKPCRGKPGARISATLDHRRQRVTADNLQILMALVNGNGITKVMRMLAPSGSGKACGAKRVYDRIFWLEKTLLAFEKAQLAKWKAELEASGEPVRHHLAHDDIVLSVNWETSTDRRLTQLNCSATAMCSGST
ncbi:MAG: hypothetical protein U1A06_16525 [Hoeflea sp.]|uniref:hypothetical protein n=1 Tax=Pseudotabrizicola sp. TaxID=2939647 RepID=UPI00272F50AC|nr:hypothetical protein [Pseudotabrizicola sp.]MDP2082013.1 hypothetical protein [Pseudotabrizicola sp.]MDZ7602972.1 hypothetical protein [Hoeflea sp.]